MAPTQEKRMHQAKKQKQKKTGHREINNNFGQRKLGPQRIKKAKKDKNVFKKLEDAGGLSS